MKQPVKYLLYLIYALLVVGLAILIIHSFNSSDKKTTTKSPVAATHQTMTKSSRPSASPAIKATKSSSKTTTVAAKNDSKSKQTLTNTGPGDDLAVFLIASGLFGLLHSRYQKSKLSQ